MKSTAVALVQMKSSTDKQENLTKSLDWIAQAADRNASLVCFPEFQMAYSPATQTAQEIALVAEKTDGEFVTAISQAARKNGIGAIISIYEKAKSSNRVYDTAVEISAKGQIVQVYRKLHLYDALGFKESRKLKAGSAISKPANTPAGKVGLMICYDLRFPELARILTVRGSEVLVAPSAWVQGEMKEEHWQTMLKARAIENGTYVIAPDQLGNIYCGKSMAVDPFGVVIADMGQREGIELVEIDRSRVKQVRASLPLLKNRRTDIYRLA